MPVNSDHFFFFLPDFLSALCRFPPLMLLFSLWYLLLLCKLLLRKTNWRYGSVLTICIMWYSVINELPFTICHNLGGTVIAFLKKF